MKIKEMLNESVTFNVCTLKSGKDGQNYWSSEEFGRKVMQPCWYCDGTGIEKHGDKEFPCDRCHGAKETEEWESDAPELNVSNSNAFSILQMLGRKGDYSGLWEHKDLPNIMRVLIRLKNGETDQYTQEPSKSQGTMYQYKDEQGMTHIGKGATIYDMGRSQSQVTRYIDTLIQLVRFAQEHNASIGWG